MRIFAFSDMTDYDPFKGHPKLARWNEAVKEELGQELQEANVFVRRMVEKFKGQL